MEEKGGREKEGREAQRKSRRKRTRNEMVGDYARDRSEQGTTGPEAPRPLENRIVSHL